MALHRKQRGPADALPQYVRLPAARASPSPVSSASTRHPRKPRARLLRDVYPAHARQQQIGSLQLRACFLLCVLLYFGTIYFADNIVSLGQALGSEPTRSARDFIVHSDAARGEEAAAPRMRGGGVEQQQDAPAKKEEEPTEPARAVVDEAQEEQTPEPGLPDKEQGETEKETETAPDAVESVEEAVSSNAAERGPRTVKRADAHTPAQVQPQRVIRDVVDAEVDAHAGPPEQRPAPDREIAADSAVTSAPTRLAEPAATTVHSAVHEGGVVDGRAVDVDPTRDESPPRALLRGAPADEPTPEVEPTIQAQEERQADAPPREEHR